MDIGNNFLKELKGLEALEALEELWASNNQFDSFEHIEQQLSDKKHLNTVYFEGNPLQTQSMATYRLKLKTILPQLQQIDATLVRE